MESESHGEISDKLSNATTQLPAAAVTHASASLGALRTGTGDGSTSIVITFIAVVLPVPCSPWKAITGCGMSGWNIATTAASTRGRSSSVALKIVHSSSKDPPRTGSGNAATNGVRLNKIGACGSIVHPADVILMARPVWSPIRRRARSRYPL
jgi:hypothetical protein